MSQSIRVSYKIHNRIHFIRVLTKFLCDGCLLNAQPSSFIWAWDRLCFERKCRRGIKIFICGKCYDRLLCILWSVWWMLHRVCMLKIVRNSMLYIIVVNVTIFFGKEKLYNRLWWMFVVMVYMGASCATFFGVCTVAAPFCLMKYWLHSFSTQYPYVIYTRISFSLATETK